MNFFEQEILVIVHQRGSVGVIAGYYVADGEVVAISVAVSGVWRLPVLHPCHSLLFGVPRSRSAIHCRVGALD